MKTIYAAAALLASTMVTNSFAQGDAQCTGGEVLNFMPGLEKSGQPITNPERTDPNKALGLPQIDNSANFVALGYGGEIILGFDGGTAYNGPGDDLMVVETTYGNIAGNESSFDAYPESADVFVSQNGSDFFFLGTVYTDEAASFDFEDLGLEYVSLVKIIDTTPSSSISTDAFDLDGIIALNGCGPQPAIEGCFGYDVLSFNQGLQTNGSAVPADRSIVAAATGEPDRANQAGGFVSLGVGGSITIGFAGAVLDGPGADIKIWETSFSGDNCGHADDESAIIEVSENGAGFYTVGTICRDGEIDLADVGLAYATIIRITSVSEGSTLDGYDLDGIEAVYGCGNLPDNAYGDCNATEVVEYIQGHKSNGGSLAAIRSIPSQALGAPERANSSGDYVFVSLGYEGSITLAFDGVVPNLEGDDIEIVETSWGHTSCDNYVEIADVYVSVDGIDFTFAKTICRADNFVDISTAGDFPYVNFIKIVNNDDLTQTEDAFDVDGVVALHNCAGLEEEENQLDIPQGNYAISAYPNPTEGAVTVEFELNETSRTTVSIVDMTGRIITELHNGNAYAGNVYRFDFDGSSLPNGIYIARVNTGSEIINEKFMIAR